MKNPIAKCLSAGLFVVSSSAAFGAPATQVRIDTGGQLATACKSFLGKGTQDAENALAPADPCRTYLAGFASAYGIGQTTTLDTRVTGAAPSPPPPSSIKVGPWTKPDAGATGAAPATAPEEKMACFILPAYLSYKEFARLVVDYVAAHADYEAKPAYLATAAALGGKYPCKSQ